MTGCIALSMGDPAGIGPELAAAAWAVAAQEQLPPFVVVGSTAIIAAAARQRGLDIAVTAISSVGDAGAVFGTALPVIDIGGNQDTYTPGVPDDHGAALALESLRRATELTRNGETMAIVTGPIAKSRLARVGFVYPGQTEYVAAQCGVAGDDAVMMLAGPHLRVVPITVHIALAQVPHALTTALIVARATIAAAALVRDFGIASPRLAVAGLNPHAGEEGRMGSEDQAVIAPAVAQLRAAGIDAHGPLPADTMFHAAARATYDVAICMYHDQALIPIKVLDFDEGVNVTTGLPIVRTSPDHGTAFGIAGNGTARVGATLAALRMAAQCAQARGQ